VSVGALETDGWLPLALPADGETFSTLLSDVSESLTLAGATVVESGSADAIVVEKPPSESRAEWLVVTDFQGLMSHGGTFRQKLTQRVRSATRAAMFAHRTTRTLAADDYARVSLLRWDYDVDALLRRKRLARLEELRLPRASAVVARRDALAPTIWERAEADAAVVRGRPLAPQKATVLGSGLAMCMTRDAVFRCAVGAASTHIVTGATMIERLRRADVPHAISRLVPESIGHGQSGIGRWTLERRIVGSAPTALTPRLTGELNVLIGQMFAALAGGARDTVSGYAASIERVAGVRAAPIVAHARVLDEVLQDIPRGFSHGDLWRDNLIVSGNQLIGIIDWVRAGDGRLPLGDYLHLSTCEREISGERYWHTVTRELLPWARAGGDDVARNLCRRIGFEPSTEILEALVLAYWYHRTATEIESYRDRARRPGWLRENVGTLADALAVT
jgi:Phosphotransferase enzyme family